MNDQSQRRAGGGLPSAVSISAADIRQQIKLDLIDKEVQSAATYSYLWMADQMGHIGLGLIFTTIAAALVSIFGNDAIWWHWLIAGGAFALGAAIKEIKDFRKFLGTENDYFKVGRELLRWNAVTATLYMLAGLVVGILVSMPLGFAGALELFDGAVKLSASLGVKLALIAGIVALMLRGAWPWLRQKIAWQKAALPYLARLPRIKVTFAGDANATRDTAAAIEAYLCDAPAVTGEVERRPMVVLGPLGVGKSDLAAAIGTEAAFLNAKVRYVTFSKLAQSAVAERELRSLRAAGRMDPQTAERRERDVADSGPANINYWPWRTAQLVIVDDIRPGLGPDDYITLEEFTARFAQTQKVGREGLMALRIRQTVWVIGALESEEQAWIDAFSSLFGTSPVVVRLRAA